MLIQSGSFWRHICSGGLGLKHSIPCRTQNCCKCITKLILNDPWGPQNGVIVCRNAPDGDKWTLGATWCAERQVEVRQDRQKRSPYKTLGIPRRARGSPRRPRMISKGARGEPGVSPRGSKGAKMDASGAKTYK